MAVKFMSGGFRIENVEDAEVYHFGELATPTRGFYIGSVAFHLPDDPLTAYEYRLRLAASLMKVPFIAFGDFCEAMCSDELEEYERMRYEEAHGPTT
jgi:hypothetical protein